MKLFCDLTGSQHEFMKKIAVSYERSATMKTNFSLFDFPENGFGVFLFSQITCYVEEKRGENSTYTANAKMPSFT